MVEAVEVVGVGVAEEEGAVVEAAPQPPLVHRNVAPSPISRHGW